MSLADLKKVQSKRTMGIDCSTNSLGFAIFEDDKPVQCGEIMFKGATVFERLNDARAKTQALVDSGLFKADYIAIEAAIMVRSISVAIKLAYVYGAVISVLMQHASTVIEVTPIAWQSGIGNKNLTKAEKDAIKAEFPGKTANWYSNKGREIRKQRTLDFARSYFKIESNSDNVGDSVGLAYYANTTLTKR